MPPARRRAFDAAVGDFERAQAAQAGRPEAKASLGNFRVALGDPEAASGHFRRALAIEPRFVAARVNLADAERRLGDEPAAEATLREGIAIDGDAAPLHHALGLLLVRTARADDGLAELGAAARLAGDVPRYAYVYAVALNSLGRGGAAIRTLRDARDRFPTDFAIGWALATMLRDAGERSAAAAVARELAAAYPGDPRPAALLEALRAP